MGLACSKGVLNDEKLKIIDISLYFVCVNNICK